MDDATRNQRPAPTPRLPLILALAMAVLGFVFSTVSTFDFIQHLDRQVHSIHCSLIPVGSGELGDSGCKTAMLSPYSSFFRQTLWGGIPVALWSMAVFAFLAWRSGWLAWRGSPKKPEAFFLVAAWGLPVVMSLVYGWLAMSKLDAVCKVCAGIYIASAGGFIAALWALAVSGKGAGEVKSGALWLRGIVGGVVFVSVLTVAYLALAPKSETRPCGQLVRDDDTAGIMLPLSPAPGKTTAIEVLDPLCPACKAFDQRLGTSDLKGQIDLKGVLFPLDTCNWMVPKGGKPPHPGACAVSEAVLCAGPLAKTKGDPMKVIDWAFANQAELLAEGERSDTALRARLEREFPEVKGCLGGDLVKNKIVKGLQWAVANAIPVFTPQLFVDKARMCDEDTDLGLEYTLAKLLNTDAQTAQREGAR